MANVMLIEGWGLAGTGTDYADFENNRKLAVLGWRYADFAPQLADRSNIEIALDPESGQHKLTKSITNDTGFIFRALPGVVPNRVCVGFQANGDTDTSYDGVGLAIASSSFSSALPNDAVVAGLNYDASGDIFQVWGAGAKLQDVATNGAFIPSIPNWVEAVFDLTGKTIEIWLNSVLLATVSLASDFPATPYAALVVGNVRGVSYGSGVVLSIGPLYVADERLGRCQVITQRPSTDSAVEFSRPQGDSNASQVADPNGYDGDTTYVSSSTSGAEDLYGTDDPTGLTNERIHGVSVAVVGRKEDIGNRSITPVCAQGTTVAAGDPVTLEIGQYLGTQSVFSVDPDTGLDWSLSGLNSSTFGVRLTD